MIIFIIEKTIRISRISVGGYLNDLTLIIASILKIANINDTTPRLKYDIFSLSSNGN